MNIVRVFEARNYLLVFLFSFRFAFKIQSGIFHMFPTCLTRGLSTWKLPHGKHVLDTTPFPRGNPTCLSTFLSTCLTCGGHMEFLAGTLA